MLRMAAVVSALVIGGRHAFTARFLDAPSWDRWTSESQGSSGRRRTVGVDARGARVWLRPASGLLGVAPYLVAGA
jgi:hypothetical protein